MNLICIPFAYEENMNSGVNVSIKGKGKIEIYLKNACVALISAKYYNPDSDVALVTNLGRGNIPEEFLSIFDKWEIKVMEIPFDQFRFQGSYTWALAFYKLCVLKKLSCMKYESICYMDTDVYIQGSFDAIWTECRQNIMLYDINHGLNTRDYVLLCDEIESYCGQRKLITHYGGEFFAASAENAKAFVDICEQVYYEMLQKNFITTKGDEFILSLAANEMRESIKNLFTWASTYQNASFQQRQAILNQFIKEVRVGRDYDIEIILNVPLEEFEEFKSHSLSVRTPSGRKMDLKQAPVRGLGTPNGGIVVFDKTSGEAMNIMPKSSAHVTLRCQDE